MGSRWAMLGSGIGQGLSQAIDQKYVQPKMLQQKLDMLGKIDFQNLNPAQLALLGVGKGGGNPLDAVLAQVVAQSMGIPMNQSAAIPQMPQIPQVPPIQNRPATSGVAQIIKNDSQPGSVKMPTANGVLTVRDKKSGMLGTIPSNEYDPNLYEIQE